MFSRVSIYIKTIKGVWRVMKLWVSFFLFFSVYAYSIPNVVLIIMDGTSQNTFYQLLRSHQLPHIESLVERGNTRTLSGLEDPSNRVDAYRVLLSGSDGSDLATEGTQPILNGETVFEQIEANAPASHTGVLLNNSIPLGDEVVADRTQLIASVNMTLGIDHDNDYRSSKDIVKLAVKDLSKLKSPFFYVVNFTNVEFVGRRYREGSELYSLAVRNCDKAVGVLIDGLKEDDLFEDTEIMIVSPYGMKRKTQEFSSDAWIVSTTKVLRKGTLYDIVPSVMSFYLSDEELSEMHYRGISLFRLE